jgi:uncharacterized protein YndB with AHSA1/START domain
MSTTDRIEKKTTLRASRARVWRAISDSKEFGSWFGLRVDGPFKAGEKTRGTIAETTVDPEVAKLQTPHVGKSFEIIIDRIEPEHVFSFRWHPHAIDVGKDYSAEPMTLVVFTLEDAPEGTHLTIVESGFDSIPLERRAKAFASNDGGWQAQTTLIKKYVER